MRYATMERRYPRTSPHYHPPAIDVQHYCLNPTRGSKAADTTEWVNSHGSRQSTDTNPHISGQPTDTTVQANCHIAQQPLHTAAWANWHTYGQSMDTTPWTNCQVSGQPTDNTVYHVSTHCKDTTVQPKCHQSRQSLDTTAEIHTAPSRDAVTRMPHRILQNSPEENLRFNSSPQQGLTSATALITPNAALITPHSRGYRINSPHLANSPGYKISSPHYDVTRDRDMSPTRQWSSASSSPLLLPSEPPPGYTQAVYTPQWASTPPTVSPIHSLSATQPENTRRTQSDNTRTTTTGSKTLRERFQTWKKRHKKPSSRAKGSVARHSVAEIRYDSLRQIDRSDAPIEEDLKNAPWYQAGIPREIALEMLTQEDIGSFVVRDSTTHPGCYALSVKVPKFDNPSGISHYLIMRTAHGGVKLKGLDKEWSSLTALVTHHSVMRELLPCPLRLPRAANNPAFRDDDKGEQEEDEDYQRLADCSHMMQDLKM